MMQGIHHGLKPNGICIFGMRVPNMHELSVQQVYQESYSNGSDQIVIENHVEEYDSITQVLTCLTEYAGREASRALGLFGLN